MNYGSVRMQCTCSYLQGFLQFVIMPLFKEPMAWIIAETVSFIKAAKLYGAILRINILLHIGLLPPPNSDENCQSFAQHPLQNILCRITCGTKHGTALRLVTVSVPEVSASLKQQEVAWTVHRGLLVGPWID